MRRPRGPRARGPRPRSSSGALRGALVGGALLILITGCVPAAERAFDSAVFASRMGQDGTGPLPWIEANPVYWQLEYVDGQYSAVVGPPCAPVTAPVTLSEDTIDVDMDRAAIADVECDGPRAAMDAWVREFIAEPLAYTLEGEVLVLTNGGGSLTFERIDR